MFDKENKNNKWAKSIVKEMDALEQLSCLKYHPCDKIFKRDEGWQYASMHDLQHQG